MESGVVHHGATLGETRQEIREASIPLLFCSLIKSVTILADSFSSSRLMDRAGLIALMSYQLGIS